MRAVQKLEGKEREKCVERLRSQITSCVILDGVNGVSEQLLINRLRQHWQLDVNEMLQKLGLKSIRDALDLFGSKFYSVNGIIKLASLQNDKSGIREVTELIHNSNIENQRLESEAARRRATSRQTYQSQRHYEVQSKPFPKPPRQCALSSSCPKVPNKQPNWGEIEAAFEAFLRKEESKGSVPINELSDDLCSYA